MAFFFGLLAAPTILLNAVLGVLPPRNRQVEPAGSFIVRGPDRFAIAVPMFNEEAGAPGTIASLMAQTEAPDIIAISVNGGRDATASVVRRELAAFGYSQVHRTPLADTDAYAERWQCASRPAVLMVEYSMPTSKADSINALVAGGMLHVDRVIVVDGDTVVDPGFVEAMKDDCYRLRRVQNRDGWSYVIEDVALQSGAVLSLGSSKRWLARYLALARSAEYAFATLIRTGQSRRIAGPVFGRSRLYTVVGCGFSARVDCFPMPSDTLTEDHDFTLWVQSMQAGSRTFEVSEVAAQGFKVYVNGEPRALTKVVEAEAEVTLRRSSDAVLVPGAQMRTEDPHNLAAYLKQVERWNAGGLESALKRLVASASEQRVSGNVKFAYMAAQLENLVGLVMLLAVPALLGLNRFVPSMGIAPSTLLPWLAVDAAATATLIAVGYAKVYRARGRGAFPTLFASVGRALLGVVPLISLRPLNALAYVTALSRVLTAERFKKTERPALPTSTNTAINTTAAGRISVTWERPGLVNARAIPARTAGMAVSLMLWGVLAFAGTALIGNLARPGYRATWDLIYVSNPLDQSDYLLLPVGGTAPGGDAMPYCSPETVKVAAVQERRLEGSAADYQELSTWGILMLARLAPLLTDLERSATSYDVSAGFLLRVVLNESFLDPLAIGPTEDIGLAQMTSDALTLLRSVSDDPRSKFHNPGLFARDFSLFDPVFSLCGGAAKLAWATDQPGGADERVAYARYINPLDGVVNGGVSPRIAGSVQSMADLAKLTGLLGATIAAYREDPESVAEAERLLLDISSAVAAGSLDMGDAYRASGELVARFNVNDRDFYAAVISSLFEDADEEDLYLASSSL